ncbi:unnamed protein product [Arabis nemorensis]|uniref:Uncharacterized protein n=1 Tax=Arabis nemorensis TaxID=586526 RepID=A0A565B0H8_9BRAS|nr:unnamed protein product [Arabis nemorensis]
MKCIQPRCPPNSTFPFSIGQPLLNITKEMRCVQGLNLWRNSSREVNHEIFSGYRRGNSDGMINEFAAAYDLLDTNMTNFNVNIWYNATYKDGKNGRPIKLVRVPGLVNLVSNAYLQYLRGPRTKILFEFVKEMPKPETKLRLDIASLIGPIFFTWVILLLSSDACDLDLIGLREAATSDNHNENAWPRRWSILDDFLRLKFFRLNDYSFQFICYFLYINLQISLAFLASSAFSRVETASGTEVKTFSNVARENVGAKSYTLC